MSAAAERKRLLSDAAMRSVYDLRVFVVGGGFQYIQMFYDAGFKGARTVGEADIVCFTGGEDVDPDLYGEKALPETNFRRSRDDFETGVYADCIVKKKPMIGICRGSQFLTVMNNGKLWQDVNGHAIHGGHDILDLKSGKTLQGMTSTHHQMMIPGPHGEILATACRSTVKKSWDKVVAREKPEQDDVEVVWYPDTLTLCFQPHPEFAYGSCRDYFLQLVDDYVMPAC